MIELDRTVTPIFVAGDAGRTEEKIFEQKVRKGTKGRKSQKNLGRLCGVGITLAQLGVRSNSVELERTRTLQKTGEKIAKSLGITGNDRSRSNSIKL